MKYDELKELIAGRCSHRKFADTPVSRETIEQLADCARFAPSGHNLQPWRFVAVSNPEIISGMADAVETALQKTLPGLPAETAKSLEDYRFFMTHFKGAPLVFVVLIKESDYLTARVSRDYGVPRLPEDMIDISLLGVGGAIQNLLLAAQSLGLGACWMTEPATFAQGKIEALAEAEEDYRAVSLVAVGWPTKERKGPAKKDIGEIFRIIE